MTTFLTEPLGEGHNVGDFDSGKLELDEWLRDHALRAEAMRTGRTFVWHKGDGKVVAYYTVAAHLATREQLPRRVGRGSPTQIPAVLLGRLALDRTLHGQGLGGALLAEALGRIVSATAAIAARVVVVDAIDEEALRFYEHHGFRAVPGTMRLAQKMSDIAASLSG